MTKDHRNQARDISEPVAAFASSERLATRTDNADKTLLCAGSADAYDMTNDIDNKVVGEGDSGPVSNPIDLNV